MVSGFDDRNVSRVDIRTKASCLSVRKESRFENLAVCALVKQVVSDQRSLGAFQNEGTTGRSRSIACGGTHRLQSGRFRMISTLIDGKRLIVVRNKSLWSSRTSRSRARRACGTRTYD